NSVVSAIQYMRNSGSYEPVPGYNPLDDIKGWKQPNYFLQHGDKFVGSQSPAETYSIKDQIDTEEQDRKILAANGKIGFIAQTMAGALDPTMLLPGGVGIDAARGGLTFTKAAIETGKAGLLATTAQEALLHSTQQTRTFEESALNVASGTLLTALIGGGAASLFTPAERAVMETRLMADRAEMNEHAGNPSTGEAPTAAAPIIPEPATAEETAGHATPAAEVEAPNTRKIENLISTRDAALQRADEHEFAFNQTDVFLTPEDRLFHRDAAKSDRMTAASIDRQIEQLKSQAQPAGTGYALAAGAAASDTRQIELVPFGLSEIPGVRRVVEKTS